MNTINGRTPEEIKKGLKYCPLCNKSCPYRNEKDCYEKLHYDALALTNQVQEDKKQLERERDAAVEDLETMGEDRAYCGTCLHNNTNPKEEPCSSCMSGYLINNWQWRGVQEEVKPDEQIRT